MRSPTCSSGDFYHPIYFHHFHGRHERQKGAGGAVAGLGAGDESDSDNRSDDSDDGGMGGMQVFRMDTLWISDPTFYQVYTVGRKAY